MEKEKSGISILDIADHHLTPGMKQYQDVKRAHPDCLVMLRMGDFYEMFYEDAMTAAKELEIILTARGKDSKRAPLAGVPYHALDSYLGKLVKKGYKVAIVEQLEDPKKAKGLVKRGLVRIVTPGTVMESSLLDEKENNYIMALTCSGEAYALAFCDISTGEFFTTTLYGQLALLNEVHRFNPSEGIIPESLKVNLELLQKLQQNGCCLNSLDDYYFKAEKAQEIVQAHFNLRSLDSVGLENHTLNVSVSGALLHYLVTTQKNSLTHLKKISWRSNELTMLLDSSTLKNLEVLKNSRDGSNRGSLLSILDRTVTAMGSRLLKQWIKEPLLQPEIIQQRLDAIEELNKNIIIREEIINIVKNITDIERLVSRVNYGNANARDILALKNSLQQLPKVKQKLAALRSSLLRDISSVADFEEIIKLLEQAIRQDAPLTVREGGIIKERYRAELDELQNIKHHGRRYIQELEEAERRKTGITTLKIGYTGVFGYFIEITKKNISLVPENYIRKQTTANSERYITPELKEYEEKILNAEEKINELEYTLFQEILRFISKYTPEIQDAAQKIAVLDVLGSLSRVAVEYNYVKPIFVPERIIHLQKSRHPVIEQFESRFVANDIIINPGEVMLLTGPNMSGKSTLMRQVALIILMAQMGSFVPAESAKLGIIDRIFTRVGAADDLSLGQSTFMVEMNETAAILNNATEKSLILLDEIGRGTSTFDGVSIAWSVAEHIHNAIKAKTLFSTHYHVLTKLADSFSRIKNYNLAVRDVKGEIIFLRKLLEGSTDQSYGVHVAELAGLPHEVISRAKEIQDLLQKDDEMMRKLKAKKIAEQKGLEEF